MLRKILSYRKDDSLVRDGITLFTATLIANIAAYFYHFYMGRVLGPQDYGVLGVVLTILYILSVPINVIQMTITKFVAHLKAQGNEQAIHTLFIYGRRKLVIVSMIVFLLFLTLIYPLSSFLHLSGWELFVFSFIIPFALLLPVSRGLLQGLQRFKILGLNMILEGLSKLGLGIFLVFLGWHIYGAIMGIVLSFAIAFFATFKPLKNYQTKTNAPFSKKELYRYATPVFLSLLALTIYYSIDVFLVKHFFSELEAGYYAAAKKKKKMIFFGTFSLGVVMFPKVAEMHSLQKENRQLLTKSLSLMFVGAAVLVLVYFLYPEIIILPLFGRAYLPIKSMIGLFGIAMTFFSFTYLLSLYNLSVQRTGFIKILYIFNILEFIFIYFYHTTVQTVISIVALLMFVLFIILFYYTYKNHDQSDLDHHPGV